MRTILIILAVIAIIVFCPYLSALVTIGLAAIWAAISTSFEYITGAWRPGMGSGTTETVETVIENGAVVASTDGTWIGITIIAVIVLIVAIIYLING